MRENAGVGPLLAAAALREHHRILDQALQLEDWTRAQALFLQVNNYVSSSSAWHGIKTRKVK